MKNNNADYDGEMFLFGQRKECARFFDYSINRVEENECGKANDIIWDKMKWHLHSAS